MKKTFNTLSVIALVLTILGALNWLLVGIFSFNLVTWATAGITWLERALYILVGISGLYMLVWLCASRGNMVEDTNTHNNTRNDTRKYTSHQNG
jgi:uncharacterized membrane protein YuzA (DUF378 family)